LTPHRHAALRLLVDGAKELPEPLSSEAISSAAVVAYYTGRRDGIHSDSVWVRALTDPDSVAVAELREVTDMPEQLVAQATIAWLQSERARDLAQLPDPLLCAAGWAYLEAGQWASARLVAAASARIAADGDLPHTAAAAMTLDTSVLALQGEATQARAFAVDALAAVTPRASASVIARGRWALGMAAVADGDFEATYDQFRMMFDDCGCAVHYHASRLAVADLAAAAARIGREAEPIVDRIVPLTRRQRNLVSRARALLAAPSEAEEHFRPALEDSDQWPFEQAATQLDYGEWLRRADCAIPMLARIWRRRWRRSAGSVLGRGSNARWPSYAHPAHATPSPRPAGCWNLTAAAATDRAAGREGLEQQGDRGAAVPLAAHGRLTPVPVVPEAGCDLAGTAARRALNHPRCGSPRHRRRSWWRLCPASFRGKARGASSPWTARSPVRR
jgi:hypothetical protein